MGSLQVLVLACVALVKLQHTTGAPTTYSGAASQPPECRIEIMNEVEHKTFYEYCSSFEDAEVNFPRNSVYFKTEKETYAQAAKFVEDFFVVVNETSVLPECLAYLQPFICFHFFKFPIPDDCTKGYVPPCTDLCERTHEACMQDFESMVEKGVVKPTQLDHLDCVHFKQTSACITLTAPTEATTTDDVRTVAPATESLVETDPPANVTTLETDVPSTVAPIDCSCAKKVRQNVTKRMILDPDFTLAAQISVLAMREEGEGADRHVVYDVTVLKEYQISCRTPLGDGENTTIHMETPLECLEGDFGCRSMAVGRDHRYLVVGTTTSDGKWLLRDSKGSGGCAISQWIPKYDEKMDKWAAKAVPSESTCALESV